MHSLCDSIKFIPMKKVIYSLISLALIPGLASFDALAQHSDWYWLEPLPQGNGLKAVYFLDNSKGYAVGMAGTIIKSIDGGNNWQVVNSGSTELLRAVHFPSASTGYVVGFNGTILKSTNGGTSWFAQTNGTSNDLYSVYFTDVSNKETDISTLSYFSQRLYSMS
jgi:photosystem II stability/assembly factor-like uncharacterized protein